MDTPVRENQGRCETGSEKPIPLAAFCDDQLSEEAGKQLVQMQNDYNRKLHKGRDLPSVAEEDLLVQIQ